MRRHLMRKRASRATDELRPEYDLRQLLKGGVRGKYAKRYHAGTNLVLLDPDVRRTFRSAQEVNDALRLVIELRKVGSGNIRGAYPSPIPPPAASDRARPTIP